MKTTSKYYSRSSLWTLFLLSAFPLHVWAMIYAFRDISWIIARTILWDAIGVLSYGMIFALLESVLFTIIVIILGFLINIRWSPELRVATMGALVFLASIIAMLSRLYIILEWSVPDWVISFFVLFAHPGRTVYLVLLVILPLIFAGTIYLVLGTGKGAMVLKDAIEKISLLMTVYLVLDLVALVLVIIRNIQGFIS